LICLINSLAVPSFFSCSVYRSVADDQESVHLTQWPEMKKQFIDEKLLAEMDLARKIVERALAARYEAGIKIRQPLASYTTSLTKKLDLDITEIVKDELNIAELNFGSADKLDTKITEQLKKEGTARELIRHINQFRKELELSIDDLVILYQDGFDDIISEFAREIKAAAYLADIQTGKEGKTKKIMGGTISLTKTKY